MIIDGCLDFVGLNGGELDGNDGERKMSPPLPKNGRHTACVLLCFAAIRKGKEPVRQRNPCTEDEYHYRTYTREIWFATSLVNMLRKAS